jgi:transposase
MILRALSIFIFDDLPSVAQKYIRDLEQLVQELQGKAAKNSENSSKPPSSDGLAKKPTIPATQRTPSGKRPGGQRGHPGSTLERVQNPDKVISYAVTDCQNCKADLSKLPAISIVSSQVFDLPKIEIKVTEHRAEQKICPCCSVKNTAKFPQGVSGVQVEYGPNVKGLGAFLMHQHLVPARRTQEILRDAFGVSLSTGSLMGWSLQGYERLSEFESWVVSQLSSAKVGHFDETGMRCEGSLHWLHVAATETLTFFGLHRKRGSEAMIDFGILPKFVGTAIHDHWDPYFMFENCKHGLCNSHILRELKFLYEVIGEDWAGAFRKLLKKIHGAVQKAKARGKSSLSDAKKTLFCQEYEALLKQGFRLHESDFVVRGKRGRAKQTKGKNLLDRLSQFNSSVLRFMHDFTVPFTNNQAEQDIRMNKVKLKISGCFRSFEGGKTYCRIRGYLSTIRKQGLNILDACVALFNGHPISLPMRS